MESPSISPRPVGAYALKTVSENLFGYPDDGHCSELLDALIVLGAGCVTGMIIFAVVLCIAIRAHREAVRQACAHHAYRSAVEAEMADAGLNGALNGSVATRATISTAPSAEEDFADDEDERA